MQNYRCCEFHQHETDPTRLSIPAPVLKLIFFPSYWSKEMPGKHFSYGSHHVGLAPKVDQANKF